MQRPWSRSLVVCALVAPPVASAADHLDSPAASAEPTADITDVYAWMNGEADRLNLVMNVHHMAGADARFSDAVSYVFHVGSASAFGEPQTEMDVVCQFYAVDRIECWAGDEYVEGDPSSTDGLTSDGGALRVFAGRRDDPFFFELVGFQETVKAVVAAAPGLEFVDGCPTLDASTAGALVGQLQHGQDGADASNSFAGSSVLSLVIQLHKNLVTAGGPIVSVWGSTHAANQGQVCRCTLSAKRYSQSAKQLARCSFAG